MGLKAQTPPDAPVPKATPQMRRIAIDAFPVREYRKAESAPVNIFNPSGMFCLEATKEAREAEGITKIANYMKHSDIRLFRFVAPVPKLFASGSRSRARLKGLGR